MKNSTIVSRISILSFATFAYAAAGSLPASAAEKVEIVSAEIKVHAVRLNFYEARALDPGEKSTDQDNTYAVLGIPKSHRYVRTYEFRFDNVSGLELEPGNFELNVCEGSEIIEYAGRLEGGETRMSLTSEDKILSGFNTKTYQFFANRRTPQGKVC